MPDLTPKARHLVQLLAEELDRTGAGWSVFLEGDGRRGVIAWEWLVELDGEPGDVDHYESTPETNRAGVVPINRLR